MRLEFLEQDVARNFKKHVWHEEDDQCRVVLVTFQAQFLGQAEDVCVGDWMARRV